MTESGTAPGGRRRVLLQAWSLAYFALRGDNPNFKKDYSKLFWECVKGKRSGKTRLKIFFTDAKVAEYDLAWRAYWKKM